MQNSLASLVPQQNGGQACRSDGRTEGLTGRGRLLARLLGGPCTDLNKFICINGHSLHWLSHRAKQSPSAIRPPLFPSLSLPSLSPHHSLSLSFTACLLIESALEPLNCWQPATSNEPFTSSQLEQVLLLCRTRLSSRLACQCVNLLPLSHSACLSLSLYCSCDAHSCVHSGANNRQLHSTVEWAQRRRVQTIGLQAANSYPSPCPSPYPLSNCN